MVHVYYGDGKGKTTAAAGMGLRAAGWGQRVLMVQFQKSMRSGEVEALERLAHDPAFRFEVMRPETVGGFFWDLTADEKERLKKDDEETVEAVCALIRDGDYGMVILDEILGSVKNGMLRDGHLLRIIGCRTDGPEIVLTGREASETILAAADYVTEMKCVKHPFDAGAKARRGIEY